MPTGKLMKNTQRHDRLSVIQPPSAGPMIGPMITAALQIDITCGICRCG